MPFEIVRNDLNDLQVDAVVRVVDSSEFDLSAEQDGHIKVESELFEPKDQNTRIRFDDVVIVPVCNHEAKYVIYIKRPILLDDHDDDDQTLASCYRKVLELANAYHCESIALPLFDLKREGWTKDLALQVASQEIRAFLLDHEMQVYLVVSKNVFVN